MKTKQFATKIGWAVRGTLVAVALITLGASRAGAAPAVATAASHADQHTVIVKLKASENIDFNGSSFTGSDSNAVDGLNRSVSSLHVTTKSRLINESKGSFMRAKSQALTETAPDQGNLDDYYVLHLSGSETAAQAVAALKSQAAVETAFAKPLPAPAPSTPSFVAKEDFLKVAPAGMGILAKVGGTTGTAVYPGSTGSSVQVADLEYSWNTSHEDLTKLRASGALWANGTPEDPFGNNDHGTAVGGILVGTNNNLGVTGIVPSTNYHMVNTYSTEDDWNVAGAIYTAANKMGTGDVILVEQQGWSPDGTGYAPIEIYPDVFDAIQFATAKGITVVEPAGNGNQTTYEGYDLGSSQFGSAFSSSHDSGALIVGAGATGCSLPYATRMAYSNYGTRVNLQGPAECVTTTGYGDLYSAGLNSEYTGSFDGTSSASAAVAGAVAELSSAYEQINGKPLSAAAIKADIVYGGTKQATGSNAGNIGVLPNMAQVLKKTDVTKPSAPTGPTATASSSTHHITVTWGKSTDNLGFVQYRLYRNGTLYKTLSTPSYTDSSVTKGKKYSYYVVAIDGSGNASTASKTVSVTAK